MNKLLEDQIKARQAAKLTNDLSKFKLSIFMLTLFYFGKKITRISPDDGTSVSKARESD